MAEVLLPSTPTYRRASPELLDAGVDQAPSTGRGVKQRLSRLGTRWALTVELPPIREGSAWLDWLVALTTARDSGAVFRWPQPGLVTDAAAAGAPIIAGAGQTGSTINLSGVNPGYTVKKGQFVSLYDGTTYALYQATAAATPSGGGALAIPIYPMIRNSPQNGSAVELRYPSIYGSVTSDNLGWSHEFNPFLAVRFRIEEVA